VKNYKCGNLTDLLSAAAHDAKTVFREVHCDADTHGLALLVLWLSDGEMPL
jgi:hypothetical protein